MYVHPIANLVSDLVLTLPPPPPNHHDYLGFPNWSASQEPFLKNQLQLRLDADSQLCQSFISTGACPLGPSCPLRHVSPSPLNFQPPKPVPTTSHGRTVCKHWLRGLCKKGAGCEFMHEYHLRKMPECWFFAKYGFCSNGDEVSTNLGVRYFAKC